jgi:hypothetical protein
LRSTDQTNVWEQPTVTTLNTKGRDLGTIQRWMQAALMHPVGVAEGIATAEARRHLDVAADEVETVLTRSRSLPALDRLAIYGHAYRARLLECLGDEFPALKHALGEELFDAFASEYLERYPSRSYTLFQLGAHFPLFLAETRPDLEDGTEADWPDFLIDLATLERTFSEVFDGPGVEGNDLLEGDQLRGIPPERLLEARLVVVPCLRLLALRYPVHHYLTAVRRSENPNPPQPVDTWLAITRRNYTVHHYELSRPACALLHALLAGASLAKAIRRAIEEAGADLDPLPNNLWRWFHDWAAEGFFRTVQFVD